jgi:putative FmdB family regulatory protein
MPVFEYRCCDCNKKFSILVGMTADSRNPACPKCNSTNLTKLISRFINKKSGESILDSIEDDMYSAGDDPKAMSKVMRDMGKEMSDEGEDGFDEYIEETERELYESGD